MKLNLISEFETKNKKLIRIYRDIHGKWYVKIDYELIHKRLNASEIVRYLSNIHCIMR